MRNLLSVLLVFAALLGFSGSVFADDVNLKNIGFTDMSLESKNNDLRTFFRNFNKYSVQHKLDKLMSMYADNYVNSDGITKKKLSEIAKEAWMAYPDVKYNQKIQFISAENDNATVITRESIKGETTMAVDYIPGNAYVDSDAVIVYYLKKNAGEWKIYADSIIHESTSLKYGVAKDIKMSIDAPARAFAGKDYIASLRVDVPKEYLAMISINNETIKYPMDKPEDAFRSIKADTVQERILKANDENRNENAIASIGIAEAKINENDVNIKIKGIALLTTRVNIVKQFIESDEKKDENI